MNLKARDVMTSDVFTVSPGLSLLDLERDLGAQRVSGAPVVEHGKLIGIVSRSDVDRRMHRERSRSAGMATFYLGVDDAQDDPAPADPTQDALQELRHLCVRDVMTAAVISVEPDTPVREVAQLMDQRRVHRLLVLEDGQLRGLISALDLVRVLAREVP